MPKNPKIIKNKINFYQIEYTSFLRIRVLYPKIFLTYSEAEKELKFFI